MSPELVKKQEYDGRQVDMWALGILLFALLTGTFPFRGQSEKELYGKIMRGKYRDLDMVSRDAGHLVSKMLEVDCRKRMRASELIRDPWIKCKDLPLSIFETAGGVFRAHSSDGRSSISTSFGAKISHGNIAEHPRGSSKAESFNRGITMLHTKTIDQMKGLGYSQKEIDDSLKTQNNISANIAKSNQNEVYRVYQDLIESGIK